MIADLKPYPAMKNSGVEWLGKVPEHWEVPRLGNLLRERGETNADGEIQEILSLLRNRGVIPYSEKGNIGNKHSEDITRYKIVRPDDIVVNCMNVIIGSVGLSRYEGCLSPVYYVLTRRSENDDPRYLNAYFQTKPFQKSLVRIGNGILAHRMRIPMELLKCELFPRPPLTEQTAIVRFLDYIDRRVRRYIRAKQKLIKLLEEQKQAIIHRAVTRGLDPDVPLKPSGVEWLGDVPEHWEVQRLKRLGEVKIGLTYSPSDIAGETGTLVLRASNIRNGAIVSADDVYVSKEVPEALLVTEGDILICVRSGSRKLVGKSALITSEVASVTYGAFMSLLRSKYDKFIFWVLNSNLFACVMAQFETSTINQLTQGDLKNLFIPVPPAAERTEILAHLTSATTDIDTAIDRARREIELLREYRTRLIADVVTGKLDVREAAAKLSDEPDEFEPLDEADDLNEIDDTMADNLDAAPEEAEA